MTKGRRVAKTPFAPMKKIVGLIAPVILLVHGVAAPEPSSAPSIPDPAELVALRSEYAAALAPFREKLAAAAKARAEKYGSELQALEIQITASGRVESLPAIRAERDAYTAGRGTNGFDEEDKRIPSVARDLRRNYERDILKLRADAAPAARPFAEKHAQKLADLERKFTSARNPDAVLAVQKERRIFQGATADPLNGGDELVLGEWAEPDGSVMKFQADGTFTSKSGRGNWVWTDRPQREFDAKPQTWRKPIAFKITVDGWGMTGKAAAGGIKTLTRRK